MSLIVLEGLRPWIIQRISALVIAAYLLWCGFSIYHAGPVSFEAWHDWVYAPYNSIFLGLFILAILFHAWIGMRDVVLDYVHDLMLRLTLLTFVMLTLIVCGLWSLRMLLLPLAG